MQENQQPSRLLITHVPTVEAMRQGDMGYGYADGPVQQGIEEAPVVIDSVPGMSGRLTVEAAMYTPDAPEPSVAEKNTKRYKRLFAPVEAEADEASDEVEEDTFGHLFDVSDDDDEVIDVERAAVRATIDRTTTTVQSIEDATRMLLSAQSRDHNLGAILDKYRGKESVKDFTRILRTNPDVRLEVGMYLLGKISKLGTIMPPRVRTHTQKNLSAMPGYEAFSNMVIKSPEWTAMLALSMLDGTYRDNPSDTETYTLATDRGVGQHRYAARTVLLTYIEDQGQY